MYNELWQSSSTMKGGGAGVPSLVFGDVPHSVLHLGRKFSCVRQSILHPGMLYVFRRKNMAVLNDRQVLYFWKRWRCLRRNHPLSSIEKPSTGIAMIPTVKYCITAQYLHQALTYRLNCSWCVICVLLHLLYVLSKSQSNRLLLLS